MSDFYQIIFKIFDKDVIEIDSTEFVLKEKDYRDLLKQTKKKKGMI
jgi:hypothetical protein